MTNTATIYGLIDPHTEKIRYVGKTSHSPHSRLREHLWKARRGDKGYKYNWLRSLQQDNLEPRILVLDVVQEDSWEHYERLWIRMLRDAKFPLTNMTDGGEGGATVTQEHYTEEWKQNISTALLGHKLSEETRRKISKSHQGKKLSEEHKRKIGEGRKGRRHTEATKRKIGRANRGKVRTAEVRRRMSEAKKNISDETREKLRKANLGRRHTEETLQKLSELSKRVNKTQFPCKYDCGFYGKPGALAGHYHRQHGHPFAGKYRKKPEEHETCTVD